MNNSQNDSTPVLQVQHVLRKLGGFLQQIPSYSTFLIATTNYYLSTSRMALSRKNHPSTNIPAYLSQKMENHITNAQKLGHFMCTQRYKWKEVLGHPEAMAASRVTIALYNLNLTIHATHLLFVYFRTWQVSQDPDGTTENKMTSQFMAVYWTFAALFLFNLFWLDTQLTDFLQLAIKYLKGCNQGIGKEWMTKRREIKICEWIMDTYVYCSFPWIVINLTVWSVIQPRNPTFVISIFIPHVYKSTPFIYLLLSGTLTFYLASTYLVNTVVIIASGIVNSYGLLALLRDLGSSGDEETKLIFQEATRRYRHLEILLKYFNLAYAPIVLPATEYVLVAVVILSFVGAFRIEGITRAVLGLNALVCYLALVVTFQTTAEFHSRSHSLLQRWKSHFDLKNPLKCRTYKTLRMLKVELGHFGYVDTTLILTLSGIILDNSINLLIITTL